MVKTKQSNPKRALNSQVTESNPKNSQVTESNPNRALNSQVTESAIKRALDSQVTESAIKRALDSQVTESALKRALDSQVTESTLKRNLIYLGSSEEIDLFENWFKSSVILGPKFRISLKTAYFCYEEYVKKEYSGNYKLTKKRFKAFLEDNLKVNGVQEPFVTSRLVYIIGFDVKPELKKVITQQKRFEEIQDNEKKTKEE